MKILIIITKTEIGGAQTFVLKLAQSLKNMGVEVEVAGGEGDYLMEELKKTDIDFYYINSLKRNANIFNSIYFIYDLYRFIKNRNYDVIHLNSTNTLVGALSVYFKKKRPKLIFTFHGLSFLDMNYEINKFFKWIVKMYFALFLKLLDGYVFVSKYNYEESKKIGLVKKEKVIYNGLCQSEMDFKSRENAREYLSGLCNHDLSKYYVIGSVGRLAYPKNYEFLINNMKSIKNVIPNAVVVIVGDGINYKKYDDMIKKLGLTNNIFMPGAIRNSYSIIKAFDVFTLTSRYEGLSISLIEALFADVPLLASKVGGTPEILYNNDEQMFKLNNIEDYIKKLVYIKNNSESIVKNNSDLKNRFTLEKMTNEYYDLYEKLIELK